MKIATTNCTWCEATMPMGAAICTSCGGKQRGSGRANPYQPRMLVAIALAAVVLIAWHWYRP